MISVAGKGGYCEILVKGGVRDAGMRVEEGECHCMREEGEGQRRDLM